MLSGATQIDSAATPPSRIEQRKKLSLQIINMNMIQVVCIFYILFIF